MKPDKRFIELLAFNLEGFPDRIRAVKPPCTSLDVANELIIVVTEKILYSIQCSDLKHKKEIKIKFLDNIERMVATMKKHRADLHMEDDD